MCVCVRACVCVCVYMCASVSVCLCVCSCLLHLEVHTGEKQFLVAGVDNGGSVRTCKHVHF